MADLSPKMGQGRSVGRNAADRLLAAIGYPERIPNTDAPFTLRVDGWGVLVEVSAGRIVLSIVLTEDESMIPALAAYAAGRMLREEATLAFGNGNVFLWQDAPADADDRALVRLFESFSDSCDWWLARVEERGKGEAVEISESVIRP